MSATSVSEPSLSGAKMTLRPTATIWLGVGIAGTMLNVLAYQSWQPLFVAATLYGLGYALLALTPLGGKFEREAYNACLATAWLAAGISALYLQFGHDPVQLDDAEDFYVLASDPYASALGSVGLAALTSGAGAILLWQKVYEFFSALGLERGRFIGITVNSLAVALNAVIAMKIGREVFGDDTRRLRRLTVVLATCGVYGLFASIHLRDALALVSVTALMYAWVFYLRRGGVAGLVFVGVATVLGSVALPLVRAQFFFVPIAMTMSGVVAILVFDPPSKGRRGLMLAIVAIGLVALGGVLIRYQDAILFTLSTEEKNYAATSAVESGAGSLGNALILRAPYPIRLVLGSIYLYAFPIPVWTGFQLRSSYHLFTSLNAIYFYITVPLVLVAMMRVSKDKSLRSPATMFLVFLMLGFTVTIAGTSIETRHLGAFLVAFQTLTVIPDPQNPPDLKASLGLWRWMLVAAAGVHLAWAVLKFVR